MTNSQEKAKVLPEDYMPGKKTFLVFSWCVSYALYEMDYYLQ